MTITVTHRHVSGRAAGPSTTRVYGTHWDDTHVISGLDDALGEKQPINETRRVITAAGAVVVGVSDRVIIISKATGEATQVTLCDANLYTGGELVIKDGKGDADTHNITINQVNGQTLDGQVSGVYVITAQWGFYRLTAWNGNWITT